MSSVEPGGDFEDLLQAYDMDMSEPLSSVVKDSCTNRSEEKLNESVPSPNDELSWEVMDVDEAMPSASSDAEYSPNSKNKHDSDDWILQPDIDKKAKDENLPVIQSVTSLTEFINDAQTESTGSNQDGKNGEKSERKEDAGSDEDDSEALVIDTSISTVNSDTPTKAIQSPRRTNGTKIVLQDQESPNDTESNDNNTQGDEQPSVVTSVKKSQNGLRIVSAEKQPSSSSPSPEHTPFVIKISKENEPGKPLSISHDSDSKTATENHSENLPRDIKTQEYGLEKGKRNETIIVIEPNTPNLEPVKWDQINFIPGSLKQEPKEIPSSAPSKVTGGSISVSASLSTGTSLSSALQTQPSVIPSMSVNSGQPLATPKTIIRSPPGKPMPQFLFRHVGPGARPSYVRLGSQALQQIARLTSPPGNPTATNAQRMISVLMDRSQAPVSGPGLATSFPHIVPGKQPGTFVTSGNPNNPLKVLIIPSQGNVNVVGGKSAPAITSTAPFANISMVPANSVKAMTPSSIEKASLNKNGQSTSKSSKSSEGSKQGKKSSNGSKNSKTSSASSSTPPITDIGKNIAVTEERFKRRMLGKVNVTKPYHPTLSGSMTNFGFSFYSCPGCRDVFINRSSLDHHKNRQSVNIFFRCNVCKTKLLFHNKCQFRCHMLKHVPELKNIARHLLETIDIQTHSGTTLKGVRDSPESELQSGQEDSDKDSTEKAVSQENQTEKEPEVENKQGPSEVPESEPTLGLTISSVSSISPDENIPVGDAPQSTTVDKPTPAERPPLFVKASTIESTSLSTQAVTVSSINPQPIINVHYHPDPSKALMAARIAPESKTEPKPLVPIQIPDIKSQPMTTIGGQFPTQIPLTPILPKPGMLGDDPTEGGNIYCTECSKTFQSYMVLQKHFNDADKPHPLKPPCCTDKLSSECCVRAHMRIHNWTKPYVCPDCGTYFRGDLAIFKKHRENCKRIMQSAMIVYPCRKCPTWYQYINELRHHIREKHSECYLKCNLCPMAFKSMPSFREHNSTKHLIKNADSANYSSIYKCPLCDSVFHDQRLKFEHLEHHINNIYATQKVSFLCYFCKKLSYSYTSMRTHLREKHRISALGNMCDYCGVDCGTISSLVGHLKKMHCAIPANMLVVPASIPEMQAAVGEKDKDLSPGEGNSQQSAPSPSSQTEEKDSTSLKAESTGKDEASNTTDNTSRDTHSPSNVSRSSSMYSECASDDIPGASGRSYKCHICLNVYPDRKALIKHKKLDHGLMKRRRRRGDQSSAATPVKKKKVEEDMRTPELQVKSDFMLRFQCDDCDYRTTSYVDLQDHRRESHGFKARFPCLLCGQTFESSAKVDEHQKSTHEGSMREYPYMCWVCDEKNVRKGYTKRAHLVKHFINLHKIPSRSIDTERLNKMDEDARLALLEETKREDSSDASTSKTPRSTVAGSFRCVKCDFQCESREKFTEHIHKHRLASDSFLCHECGMCFTVMTALKNHLRLVHRIKKFEEYVEKYKIKLCSPPSAEKPKRPLRERKVSAREVGDSLECNVCYKLLPGEGALKNHMRSHGMAFIRSKRLAPMAFLAD